MQDQIICVITLIYIVGFWFFLMIEIKFRWDNRFSEIKFDNPSQTQVLCLVWPLFILAKQFYDFVMSWKRRSLIRWLSRNYYSVPGTSKF